jgi:hypothetical protein
VTTIVGHTTRAPGTILTHTIYNSDHVNHITNATALNSGKVEVAGGPVVDGHAALWLGTDGKGLKTAGFAPANVSRQIITNASGGLQGGGDLSADRTLALILADQAEAEAGAENTKAMTALRTAQAIAKLTDVISIGSLTSITSAGQDTGVPAADGSIFLVTGAPTWEVSTNGGTNYHSLGVATAGEGAIVVVKGTLVAVLAIGPSTNAIVSRIVTTGGAGNIFFRVASGTGGALRVAHS